MKKHTFSSNFQSQLVEHKNLLSPTNGLSQFSHLWRKKRKADVREQNPEVLLSMLDIKSHPHHQSLKNCFFIWNVDVIAGEQFNNLSRGKQQELLVLNDLQEMLLEQRGDTEETDNHQLLADEYARCRECVLV